LFENKIFERKKNEIQSESEDQEKDIRTILFKAIKKTSKHRKSLPIIIL